MIHMPHARSLDHSLISYLLFQKILCLIWKVLICSTNMEVQDTLCFTWSVHSSDIYKLYGTWASTLDHFTLVFCSIVLLKNSTLSNLI